jgi:hypothetical protein
MAAFQMVSDVAARRAKRVLLPETTQRADDTRPNERQACCQVPEIAVFVLGRL